MKFSAVLPRVMFEQFSEADYSHVLRSENARDDIAEMLVQVCKDPKHKFDGIVLEVWFQLAGRVQDKHLLRLVEHLGEIFFFYFSFHFFFRILINKEYKLLQEI